MNSRQARLSLVMGVVAALGTAAILWAWWDSMHYYMLWATSSWVVSWDESKIVIWPGRPTEYLVLGFNRAGWVNDAPRLAQLFPGIGISPEALELPMWFLLSVFLSAMLLLWLVLMKRLARRRITEGSSRAMGG